jgi:hypothetical protein
MSTSRRMARPHTAIRDQKKAAPRPSSAIVRSGQPRRAEKTPNKNRCKAGELKFNRGLSTTTSGAMSALRSIAHVLTVRRRLGDPLASATLVRVRNLGHRFKIAEIPVEWALIAQLIRRIPWRTCPANLSAATWREYFTG